MVMIETRGPRHVGDRSVTQVVEWEGEALPHTRLFPTLSLDALRAASPPPPHTRLSEAGMVITANQFFVVQGKGEVSVIEMGTGNGKSRPDEPYWDHQNLPYEETLASLGVSLEDVRYAFISHGHLDHTGFATSPAGDGWAPSFPNARYVMHPREWEYWGGMSSENPRWHPCIEDTLRPLVDAGVVHWASDGEVVGGLVVHHAPGHTPGKIVLELSGGQVWFVGDMLHHPAQIAHPEWSAADFDTDREGAIAQREKYLPMLADTGSLVYAMHLGNPFQIERSGAGLRYVAQD